MDTLVRGEISPIVIQFQTECDAEIARPLPTLFQTIDSPASQHQIVSRHWLNRANQDGSSNAFFLGNDVENRVNAVRPVHINVPLSPVQSRATTFVQIRVRGCVTI